MGDSVFEMRNFDWKYAAGVAAYLAGGIATDVVAEMWGMIHQSNLVYYILGALLRIVFWPSFWFERAHEALLGF